jgi:hypothetical protein
MHVFDFHQPENAGTRGASELSPAGHPHHHADERADLTS